VFQCPTCRTSTRYSRRKVTRTVSVFFIPLIPIGDMGEIVRCEQCRSKFHPDVLKGAFRQPGAPPETWACESCGNINPDDRAACLSCGRARS
jgi:hypothetical protein